MNYLRYSSDEMFSSTELIRKSKNIFDKLNKNEIEKAIILRDGKPSFMLLDFATYEKIMKEYEALKSVKVEFQDEEYMSLEDIEIIDKREKSVPVKKAETEEKIIVQQKVAAPEVTQIDEIEVSEINDEELQKALEEIENMNLDDDINEDKSIDDEDFEISLDVPSPDKSTKQPLKEFWD